MTDGSVNVAWARAFVDELARIGIRHACVSPGSRSTPLVLALADEDRIRVQVHPDERSAAFFALGIGKATGRAAAVVTTSGTAVANLHPAVVEADQSRTPLLLLTADRPRRLRGTDANQTVDQLHAYGGHVRQFLDAAPPSAGKAGLRYVRVLAARAEWASRGHPPGPVQVNFPFDKPLQPQSREGLARALEPGAGRPGGRPFTAVSASRTGPSPEAVARLARRLRSADRPMVVAGPLARARTAGPGVVRLARMAGAPLLADPLSGARFCPGAAEAGVPAYDVLLRDPPAAGLPEPDFVLRLGPAPTSGSLREYLAERPGTPQAVADPGGRWMDHAAAASDYLHVEPGLLCEALADHLEREPPERDGWPAPWREAGRRAGRGVREAVSGSRFEGCVLHHAAEALPGGGTMIVGSSMPVRDLDVFGLPRDRHLRVLGNRGASGIDGLVSLALGAAAAVPGPVAAVCGDLSLVHDMNGLLAARDHGGDVTFVVINNDGGGIFHLLPIREFDPPFTELFATPHGLDLSRVAALHDLPYRRIREGDDLGSALSNLGREGAGVRMVEVESDRERNRERRREAVERILEAASAAG